MNVCHYLYTKPTFFSLFLSCSLLTNFSLSFLTSIIEERVYSITSLIRFENYEIFIIQLVYIF